METYKQKIRNLLGHFIDSHPAEALLFSGGVDSSVLAALDTSMTGITVTLEGEGQDLGYARTLAASLNLKQIHRRVSLEEALAAIPEVIGILRSFDPALPNDLAAWFGLKEAGAMGFKTVMTGDGSDELLGGYDFMREIKDLQTYIDAMSRSMTFSSNRLGTSLGLNIIQPFLHEAFAAFAREIPAALKIRQEGVGMHGKWILRKTFEEALPAALTWQSKRPLETGSGMTRLRQILNDRVTDEEMKKHGDGIDFYSREHYYYYRIYKEQFGPVQAAGAGEGACPGCGGLLPPAKRHCALCGWAKRLET